MADVSFNFSGKTALVTGAGRGIGRAIAEALAKAGAKTFALGKTQTNLDDLVALYPSIHPLRVDLSNWQETRKAVEQIGPIDFLVNNAAVLHDVSFLESTEEIFDQILNVNLKAVFNVSQVVARGMIARKSPGSIVNISSIASMKAFQNLSVYCTAKGGLDALTRSMAKELGSHKIRVNSVHPTVVNTDMGKRICANQEFSAGMSGRTPLERYAEVSDVVGPVLHLLSDSSSMVTGAFVTVDGGFVIG